MRKVQSAIIDRFKPSIHFSDLPVKSRGVVLLNRHRKGKIV